MKVAKTWTFYTPGNVKVGNGMNHSSFVGQIDSGLAWFSVVYTLADNDICHHSGQNIVDSRDAV